MVKNLPIHAGDIRDVGLIPGTGRSPGGHGNPLQYSCQENPTDRGVWHLQSIGSQRVGHNRSDFSRIYAYATSQGTWSFALVSSKTFHGPWSRLLFFLGFIS